MTGIKAAGMECGVHCCIVVPGGEGTDVSLLLAVLAKETEDTKSSLVVSGVHELFLGGCGSRSKHGDANRFESKTMLMEEYMIQKYI